MDDLLDSREFYELMQAYRWSGLPHSPEPRVVDTFEAVKTWVRTHYAARAADSASDA